MKIIKNVFFNFLFLLVVSLIFSSHLAWAVPAAPDLFIVQQPDGTTVEVYNKGDERLHWIETKKGLTIAKDKRSRKWFYVDHFQGMSPVLSSVRADTDHPRSFKKHIRPEKNKDHAPEPLDESFNSSPSAAPSSIVTESAVVEESLQSAPAEVLQTTSGNIVFILVEFDDRAGTYASQAEWSPFVNEKIADYFQAASYGNVNLSPAQESSAEVDNGVIGWITLPRTHPGSDGETTTLEKQPLAQEAIMAADPYINYAAYDSNADGFVDADELAIVVVVAGYEDSIGGGVLDPGVWAHKWSLPTPPTLDGVIVGAYNNGKGGYAMIGEIHTDHQATMGVMVHELGHLIFGFPDLYDTDGSSSGIGYFCLMSGGSWGKSVDENWDQSGATPVLPSAWIKQRAGWVVPPKFYGTQAITAAGDAAATFDNTVYRLNADYSSEYFLVENRQASGYDRGFERWFGTDWGGLTIYHIDDTQINNTNDIQRWVDLEEADGIQMVGSAEKGSPAKLWFAGQSSNQDGFNAMSEPDSRCYDGTDSFVSVTDISVSAPVMTATLMGSPFYFHLLYEDFDGETPHLGWSVEDNEGVGRVWQYEQFADTFFANLTLGTGQSANADSWYYYNHGYPKTAAMDTELISPPFNPFDYATTFLSFKNFWYRSTQDKLNVDIRCDGGAWDTLWTQADILSTDTYTKVAPVLNITAYTSGKSSCQIRFHYYDALIYSWQVDDVEVTGTLLPTAYSGNDYPLPGSQWRIMSLPRDPGGMNTVADVFSDDFPEASYGTSWILYERDIATDSYVTLAEDAPLNLGQGYWIYSYDAATLDITGNPTVPSYTPDCPTGCFEIPLIKATSEVGSYRFNLLGHPSAHDVAWEDVRLKVASGDSSTLYSPTEADNAGYLSKVLYKYESGWVPFDDVTPGMQGSLVEFDGFLVEVLGGGIVDTYDSLSFLIPIAQPAVAVAPEVLMSAQAEALQTPAPVTTFDPWERNVPNSHSVKPDADGWFVRLIATDDANTLQDQGNVLGQLPDSDAGYDLHDLPEFSPMGGDYLTIVFPHADWGEQAGDYASDFHAYSQKNRQDSWQFEVRTNDSHREVTLSWAGLPEVLQRSVLIDNETGDVIRMRFVEEYTFAMNGTTRSFTWKYKGRRR